MIVECDKTERNILFQCEMHRVAKKKKKKRFAKNIYMLIITTRALFYSVQSVVSKHRKRNVLI